MGLVFIFNGVQRPNEPLTDLQGSLVILAQTALGPPISPLQVSLIPSVNFFKFFVQFYVRVANFRSKTSLVQDLFIITCIHMTINVGKH